MRDKKDARIFFALWPDDGVRIKIAANLDRIDINPDKCRWVTNSNLHLTLHFVGNTSIAEMKCLDRQAREFDAEPFDLTLDYSGYFKKPKVLWIGCQAAPEALYNLYGKLGEQISQCAYTPEIRPYSPDRTVARKFSSNCSWYGNSSLSRLNAPCLGGALVRRGANQTSATEVPPNEGNEVRRDGRLEVVAPS